MRLERKRTGSSDGEGTLNSAEFLVGDEGGVGSETNVDLVGLQEAGDVLRMALLESHSHSH